MQLHSNLTGLQVLKCFMKLVYKLESHLTNFILLKKAQVLQKEGVFHEDFFSKCDYLVTFTEKMFNEKLHFLHNVRSFPL